MDFDLALKLAVALSPVVILIVVFERLDGFRLVSAGSAAAYALSGAVLAIASLVLNGHVLEGLPIGFTDYSLFVAPVIEEIVKAALVIGLFAMNRIGFKLDAAVVGFAIGAGFAVFENSYYVTLFPDANLGVWIVRGFGTAIMHGGATALFAVITHEVSEHRAHNRGHATRLHPWVFIPGLVVAIAIHGAFNQFPGEPLLAMLGAAVVIPLTLLVVFSKGGVSAHGWLEHDKQTHAEQLAAMRSGTFAETPDGQAIAGLSKRFPERIAAEAREWIEVQLALVLRAEELLLAHEQGKTITVGETERAQFRRMDELARHIGLSARHALAPHLPFTRTDLYEMNMLRHRVGNGHKDHQA